LASQPKIPSNRLRIFDSNALSGPSSEAVRLDAFNLEPETSTSQLSKKKDAAEFILWRVVQQWTTQL